MPGPVGKRSDQRHGHRTKAEIGDVDKPAAGAALVWYPEDPEWSQTAKWWYESMRVSGQSVFYEQSDVATVYYVAGMISKSTEGNRVNGQLFGAIMSAMSDLLATEGSRRRVKIELQRDTDEPGTSEVDSAILALSQQFG